MMTSAGAQELGRTNAGGARIHSTITVIAMSAKKRAGDTNFRGAFAALWGWLVLSDS